MKIKCSGEYKPIRGTAASAGIDLFNNGNDVLVHRGFPMKVETKTAIEIPDGYVGLVCVRSGLGFKGLDLINSCGVIDSDYRGDIGLKFINHSDTSILLKRGDRIAQIVVVPYLNSELEFVDNLSETERGTNGFGSTGK